MLREKETVIRNAMILFDAFIVSIVFFLAYFLRLHFHAIYKLDIFPSLQVVQTTPAPIAYYFSVLLCIVPLWCIILYWNGIYRSLRTKSFLEIAWIIIKSSFLMMIVFGTIIFSLKLTFVSRAFFVIFMILSSSAILLEKAAIFLIVRRVRRWGYNYRRLLVVGTGTRAAGFINKVKHHPEWGFKILGVVDDEPERGIKDVNNMNIIGSINNITDMLHLRAVDEVIFMVPRSRLNHIEDAIYSCETEGVKATVALDLFESKLARSRLTELDGIPLLTFETTLAKEWQLFVKRTIDIIVACLAIILLSPLYLVVSIAIKLTSPGPALFIQKRVGVNGRKFVLYKFRTMYKDTQKKLSSLERLNEMKGPVFKIKNDPRITPIGKILRKFSIDELPQLFNVLVGCMSLVGPRPPIPKEVGQYSPWQRRRLSMRPGLTCLWQINGRNKIKFDDWMKLDLNYIDHWSLWLDFKILIKTIPVVVSGIGAY